MSVLLKGIVRGLIGESENYNMEPTTLKTEEVSPFHSWPCICPCRWLQIDAPWCRGKADSPRGGWRGWLHSPTHPRAYRTAPSSPLLVPWSEECPLDLGLKRQGHGVTDEVSWWQCAVKVEMHSDRCCTRTTSLGSLLWYNKWMFLHG